MDVSVRGLEKAIWQILMCKLIIRHDWHIEHADDGGVSKRCRGCGKDNDERTRGGGNFSHWAGA